MPPDRPNPGPYDLGQLMTVSALQWGAQPPQEYFWYEDDAPIISPSRSAVYYCPLGAGANVTNLTSASPTSTAHIMVSAFFGNPLFIDGVEVKRGSGFSSLPELWEESSNFSSDRLECYYVLRPEGASTPSEVQYVQSEFLPEIPANRHAFRLHSYVPDDLIDPGDTLVQLRNAYVVAPPALNKQLMFAPTIEPISDRTIAISTPSVIANLRHTPDRSDLVPIYEIDPPVSGVEIRAYRGSSGLDMASFRIETDGLIAGTYPITVGVANFRSISWSTTSFTLTVE